MRITVRSLPAPRQLPIWRTLLAMLALTVSFAILWKSAPLGVDWSATYSKLPSNWRDPYAIPGFANPPWLLLFLPHAVLPVDAGNAVNLILNIVAIASVTRAAGGKVIAVVLALTSPFFFDLARTNNVDWIPVLALVVGPAWGLPLIAAKPQGVGGAAVVWAVRLLRNRDWKGLLPLIVAAVLSLFWGFWPLRASLPGNVMWNFAPFPFGVPLGLWIMWHALRNNDQWLGAAATPFLVPYLAPYSAAGLLGLVLARYPAVGKTIWVATWVYLIVETRRLSLIL